MPINLQDGQFVPSTPFVPPEPICPGTDEERFERHRCRFLGLPFDLDLHNRMRAYAAYRRWHHRTQLEWQQVSRHGREEKRR